MRLLSPDLGSVDTYGMHVGTEPEASFEARFTHTNTRIHLTGLQALARLPLDQVRRDAQAGLRVAGFVSGYPGSPLAGFDQVLRHIAPLLEGSRIEFQPGLNEELAAAAVAGSQLVDLFPHPDLDGVIGLWFGKAPGVDRCLDVFRHANFAGISRHGGALLVAGDDPGCKSSSLPSQSDRAFAHAMIPLLAPADAPGVIELGLHAYALSRYAGLFVGLRVVADVCDGGGLVSLPATRPDPVLPAFEVDGRRFERQLDPHLLPPMVRELERDLIYARLEAARRYAYENHLDRIVERGREDRVGFVAAGHHGPALRSAFEQLQLRREDRRSLGLRVLELGMVFPVEERRVREFAEGLECIVVLDDRQGALEGQIRDALYASGSSPEVLGRRDDHGEAWIGAAGALDGERLALDLGPFLSRRLDLARLARRSEELRALVERRQVAVGGRRPHFCSGCPHLTSTRVPDGLAAAGGIGCHTMVLLQGGEMRYVGAMGSEGAHWNGLAPFVETPHLFQNLGDGTYFHSGRQAIRACVAAGTRITFKLLYNGAVAMTGGQQATGEKPAADVIRDLLADGVGRVVAVSEDPEVVALSRCVPTVERVSKSGTEDAQRRLAEMPGVTVFFYDEACANAQQRKQRRGLLPAPVERILIQRDVCEGCGDCGRASQCLSVRPIATALGRKTEIHQGSCSQDETCLQGDCPAFVTVSGRELERSGRPVELIDPPVPEEDPILPTFEDEYSILMVGIGSTGVVTVDAVLVAAAARAGLQAVHLDQTGLAQRGGRVASHLRLQREAVAVDPRVPRGRADALLAFDPLGAVDAEGLAVLDPERTRTIAHEHMTPTAEMVSRPDAPAPRPGPLLDRLASLSRELHALPAEPLAEALFGTHLAANVLLLGFAYQRGAIPIPADCIEAGLSDCGVAVETNRRAFAFGRAFAADPDAARQVLEAAVAPSVGDEGDPSRAALRFGASWEELTRLLGPEDDLDPDLDPSVLPRTPLLVRLAGWAEDLADYQDMAYAERYVRALFRLAREERGRASGASLVVTPVAARELYRLMAYKDEYEVARLHLRGPWRRWLDARFGGRAKLGFRLHPPLLRALGLKHKLALGPWFEPCLAALVAVRRLRGTLLDPFSRTAARRLDRRLVDWYEATLERLHPHLDPARIEQAATIAGLAGSIRGYEGIRAAHAWQAVARAERALTDLDEKEPGERAQTR